MESRFRFDYYYGAEADQFSFYRVPRALIKDSRFKGVSSDAKLLYGLMLDRMAMSMKNGWLDVENRVYIIYTLEDIMEDLNCSKGTGVKILAELDTAKGIGLIERKKRGQGKPTIIYVKNFITCENQQVSEGSISESQEVQITEVQKSKNWKSGSSSAELQEVQNLDFKESEKRKSRGSETGSLEVQNVDTNYNNTNYSNLSYINPINQSGVGFPSGEGKDDTMDMIDAYIQFIRENIEYEHYMNHADNRDKELVEELYQIICDVVCVKRKTLRIGGEDYPYELVKAKFLKLNQSHIEYVMGCMKNTTTKIGNIRSYMITALYNAPNTMNHYFQQEVRHDMFGGGWNEKGIT
ncbi:MAG: DUF6017 domain-containing protein [Lachnospiraceae bacterium]